MRREGRQMPVHDWTRVNPGLFHHFHHGWTAALCNRLNAGTLPPGFYALAEQTTGGLVPDVLTPETAPGAALGGPSDMSQGVAVAGLPPGTQFVLKSEAGGYADRANRIAIRHPLGDVVAILEIVSPGNKSSRAALRSFVEKSVEFLRQGIHLLVVDLFPPNARNPQGIHKAIWDEIDEQDFTLPAGKPLTLEAYVAWVPTTAYVEPIAVGDVLPDMPLFLDAERYVATPLEETYRTTWDACPAPLRDAVEHG